MYRSELLYNNIDKFIEDSHIYPICIPSYNRPDSPFLKSVQGLGLPIVLFIRKEQYDLYKGYQDNCEIVLLEEVNEIGETRKAIVDWAIKNRISNIFMIDDDISHLSFLMPGKSSKSDKEFMKMYSTIYGTSEGIDPKIFKMWIWLINRCDEKLTISGPGAKSDWWNIQYKDSTAVYNSGSTIQCIHLNIDNLKKFGLNYINTNIGGTEDYTLQYLVMSSGLYCSIFKDLVFRVPGVGSGNGGNTSNEELIQKYTRFINLFFTNILLDSDKGRVSTKVSKGGIPSVKFNWNKWREPKGMLYTCDDIFNYLELMEE